ncbi:hypothetical protein PAPYR_12619 [Paratrimastix pyriformis]|uniref:Uncharacterized protein n=1 Tax=Paratrimastix pyriformis TaxID=342808 RepID=A0ABQ8U1J6_9EUKA|nr:hypothetical protein PAPYR_12619 [Paratrimastix pyriformis]
MADSSTSIQAAQLVLCPGASTAQITTSSNNPVKFPSGAIVSSLSVTGASDFVGDVVFHGNIAPHKHQQWTSLRQLTDVSIAADDTTDKRLMRYSATLGRWVADITYDEAASSGTVVKRTANGTINAAVINASGSLVADTVSERDVYSTNGAITVVANRDRTGFESFDNTPGYAFDASYHLAVESGTGWVAGKRFAWTPAVLNTDTTVGTPTHLTVEVMGLRLRVMILIRYGRAASCCSPSYTRRRGATSRSRDDAFDFAATLTGTQLALSPYILSYRGITIKSAAITNVTEIHNFAFTGGVLSVPQISTSISARTSSGSQSTNYSVHLLGLMPCATGPIVVDILSPNTFTSRPKAISIDNRATSIQFVGSLAMLHAVAPFMWVIVPGFLWTL